VATRQILRVQRTRSRSPWRGVENVHTQVSGKSALRRAVGTPNNRISDRPFAARPRANLVTEVEKWKHEFERRSISMTVAWIGETDMH
jgi:hypothetical protein